MLFYRLDENKQLVKLGQNDNWANVDHREQVAFNEPIIGTIVSTVFLGYDTSGINYNNPICFETYVASENPNVFSGVTQRYSTWQEAVAGHKKWCNRAIDEALGDRQR